MKTIAFALITVFLFSGCVVRVVEPKNHTYGYKSKYSHHYQERKGYAQKPAPNIIVYRDVVNTTNVVKNISNKNVQVHYRTERTIINPVETRSKKEINKKVRKTKKASKVQQHSEDKQKKQKKYEKRSKEDKR